MRLQIIGSLTFLTLCGVVLGAQTSAPNSQKPPETPKTANQLYVEDQDDLHGPYGKPRYTEEEYLQLVRAREATLRSMLASGEIKAGNDFRDAAFIFQHGNTADDCLFAHILAIEAMAHGTPAARWIAAATLDRYLQFTKQPQIFGTQYITDRNAPIPGHAGPSPLDFGRNTRAIQRAPSLRFSTSRLLRAYLVPAKGEYRYVQDWKMAARNDASGL